MEWPGSEAAALKAAWSSYQEGRYGEAADLYTEVLARNPVQLQALVYVGLIGQKRFGPVAAPALVKLPYTLDPGGQAAAMIYQLGAAQQDRHDDESAITLFQQSLLLNSQSSATYNDLGVSLSRLGNFRAALDAFDQAIIISPDIAAVHRNRAVSLAEIGQADGAIEAFRRAVTPKPDDVETWNQFGLTCLKFEKYKDAEAAIRQVLVLDSGRVDAHLTLVQILDRSHQLEEAEKECVSWARRQGVLVKPCRTTPEARVLLIAGASLCNTPVTFLFGDNRYESTTLYLLPESTADLPGLLKSVPPFDIAFNTVADSDRGAAFLDIGTQLCRLIAQPVMNHPERIAHTRRDRMAALLADVPGLVVPRNKRFGRAELEAFLASPGAWRYPLLIRPVGLHNGYDLARIDSPVEMARYLENMPPDDCYLTDYVDYVSPDGYYRKYRFIFVGGEVFPYHLAIQKHWMIHYWRANMNETEWMKREEEAFLADPHQVFTPAQIATVTEVARRVNLDYAGMDCAVANDGRMLFFESNANMLVHLNDSPREFPYKHQYVPRIFEAMSRLVARKVAGHGAG